MTNKRKLKEASSDPARFDAVYEDVKAQGYQPVADRFVSVVLKLKEHPDLFDAVQSSDTMPSYQRGAASYGGAATGASYVPPARPVASPAGAALRDPARTPSRAGTIGSKIPSAWGADRPQTGRETIEQHMARGSASTPTQRASAPADSAAGTPALSSRGMVLREKKGSDIVPSMPDWSRDRPFLTGDFLRLSVESPMLLPVPDMSRGPAPLPISSFPHTVQQVVLMDELLNALLGIEGKYVKAAVSKGRVTFHVDVQVDSSIADLMNRMLPLAAYAHTVNRYVDVHSRYEYGSVCHAFCAALRRLMKELHVLVTQLEHQFKIEELTLQKFWFYVQPTLRVFTLMDRVIVQLTKSHSVGGAVLNVLYEQELAIGGDQATQDVFSYLLQEASAPFFKLLSLWVCEGRIEDPYDDFFIEEHELESAQDSLEVYNEMYWKRKFTVRDEMLPVFLAHVKSNIYNAGKFLHVIRQCKSPINAEVDEFAATFTKELAYTAYEREYTEKIETVYNFASQKLLQLMMGELKLIQHLRSLKRFFLLDQGDYFIHFMDVAESELNKNVADISITKLRSMLDMSLRSSTADRDPHKVRKTPSWSRSWANFSVL
jgi:gamma-tubulin complex component 2